MSPPRSSNYHSGDIDVVTTEDTPPLSRTHQYRKVMKPLLERKRRARINSYLDELKDLMVSALQAEGESITKLEKADVLELTLKHLQKLKRQQLLKANPAIDMDRYRAGYTACASEVGRFMSSIPGVNINFGTHLMSYLGEQVTSLKLPQSSTSLNRHLGFSGDAESDRYQKYSYVAQTVNIPESSTLMDISLGKNQLHLSSSSPLSDRGYHSGREPSPSPSFKPMSPPLNLYSAPLEERKDGSVWRPF